MESLALVLGERADEWDEPGKRELADRKNGYYLELIAHMTPADALPGAVELLRALRERGVPTAVASSSRNAKAVLDRLEIATLIDAVVDGHDIQRSKPDPQVFLMAAARLGVDPRRCAAVEDAASGVESALAAGMRVVGIGPPERVGRAHRVVDSIAALTADDLVAIVPGAT
jgi:beta-phosphoglucomutase